MCMVEQYQADIGSRLRALHDKPSPVFPDGALLVFGAGQITLKADEWSMAGQVEEICVAACLQDSWVRPATVTSSTSA